MIDIWDTHSSEKGRERAKELYEWGWGRLTCEKARETAETCMNSGYNQKYLKYFGISDKTDEAPPVYSKLQQELMNEMHERYPEQGMLAWDLVRTLSIVGGAYMSGVMPYDVASKLALEACRKLQQSFTSWDDVAENYTLGYQFWRDSRATDRLRYYKKLKKTWIYEIPWDTVLREEEL